MDDNNKLLESIHGRLADLDRKVQVSRHELEADFVRYYHDVLHDVPPSVAEEVRRSLLQSLPNYPALIGLGPSLSLSLGLSLDRPEPPADSRALAHPGSGQSHSPPTVGKPSRSGATEPPGSPRDRGQELQGLFTPTYLPLLDSSPRLPTSPPTVAAGLPNTPVPMRLPDPGIEAEGQGAGMDRQGPLLSLQDALPVTPELPARPGHVRRSTDDTTSSVLSDRSDVKTPRSALRRSSSASKPPQSPRRVRFEFMGAEVLPTASPQASDFIAPPVSPTPPLESVSPTYILDDDDEFENQPPPRKISSSEALRALSRAPLDAGTVWTVVNPNSDEIIVEQEEMVSPAPKKLQEEFNLPMAPDPPTVSREIAPPLLSPRRLGKVTEEPEEDVESDNSSDDDFLSMAKPKSFANKQVPASLSPTKETIPGGTATSSSSDLNSQGYIGPDDIDTDEDDMFHFEGLSAPPRPRPAPLAIEEEEVVEDDVADTPVSKPSLYATSPAVSIAKPPAGLSGPTTPTMTKFQAGSLGSYKGRPIIMPVVRNPEIHAQAASLGQFNTFVGGLDGRSGMDEGDLSSFRASVSNNTGFSGTPRSFTERLMMEDAQLLRNKGGSDLPQ
ncbi:hypothetical protein B0T10DRAFT_556817 [Thelonectria olida]|uniref:Uncharacterized protein n=1 Tax=Thelonectria olida TaxID=1576542 RepID=A0A9P8WGB9_9HYPO|nr:hypothetical protein B0T10DRAFT_556817 [Thelonectria olida]